MKISFLHTSKSHVERFDKIVTRISESIQVEHFVNEQLLTFAQQTGSADKEGFNQEVRPILKNKSDMVICTCSTYGDSCDELNNVYRIDQPIAAYIISNYSNIGIAYTLDSTKEISKRLLEKLAKENEKSIQLTEIDCSCCWIWFQKNDIERYELEIAKQIKNEAKHIEIVLLAQASMEGATPYLKDEKYQVVSSPEYGVKKYIDRFRKGSFSK